MRIKKNHIQSTRPLFNRLLTVQTSFPITEAYKTVRTNLLFSLATAQKKTVIVSSALPGEGKTTTCSNLAITMAQTGAKVLLIDGDLRKPAQNKVFRVSNNYGLSTVLLRSSTIDEATHQNVRDNLDLLTSGPTPPNPSELLGSHHMVELLQCFEEKYDYIFIDSSPINVVSDILTLSSQTAGILLVVWKGVTTHEQLKKTIESIEFANTKIVGVVLSMVKKDESRYSYRRTDYYQKYGMDKNQNK